MRKIVRYVNKGSRSMEHTEVATRESIDRHISTSSGSPPSIELMNSSGLADLMEFFDWK